MSKKLIVCFDGTWNTPSQEDNGVPAPTNVYKIYRALADEDNGVAQEKYYHTGVGTEGGKLSKILDGAFGSSLGEHIESAYYWLADHYKAGDSIFMFGFSRGAFTVRSLGGMLAGGLLDLSKVDKRTAKHEKVDIVSKLSRKQRSRGRWKAVKAAYAAYRRKGQHLLRFQSDYKGCFFHQADPVPIDFLGVWDTVGAAGIPDDAELLNALFDRKRKWEFHDKSLGKHVKVGRHAMALDEIRASFTVTRWSNLARHADAVEKWFPGVHSDVGGGYEDSGLSDGALEWMISEAKKAGLAFSDVSGQIHPNPLGVIHNSYKGVFQALRSRPRNVPAIIQGNKELHDTVLIRQSANLIKYPDYWPTKRLKKNQSVEIDVFASNRWNKTGIYLKAGETYVFESSGEWIDKKDACDWRGTEKDREFTMGDVVRFGGSLWSKFEKLFDKTNASTDFYGTKRVEEADWFSMIGAIANDKGVADPVNNDGSPTPHEYICLPLYGTKASAFRVKTPGYLYAFPNDAWHFYENNKGSIRLKVKRLK